MEKQNLARILDLMMHNKLKSILFLILCFTFNFKCFSQESLKSQRPTVLVKPLEIDWKNINLPRINYVYSQSTDGIPVYTVSSESSLKFKWIIVFDNGIYKLSESDRLPLGALSQILLTGGFGSKSFAQINDILTQEGLTLFPSLNSMGQLTITVEGLFEDFDKALTYLKEMLLKPNFDPSALELWKQQMSNEFENLKNAGSMDKQYRYIEAQSYALNFGSNHYFAKSLARFTPKYFKDVTMDQVKSVYEKIIFGNGALVFISGKTPKNPELAVSKLFSQLKNQKVKSYAWLPERMLPADSKINTSIITKDDMTQCEISLKFLFDNLGDLNNIEAVDMALLGQIFSSKTGTVGNDRFSKALRADTGLSYSPHGYFIEDLIFPNTNVASYFMNFQSSNENAYLAVKTALNTWNTFIQNGVTLDELTRAKTSLTNSILASEQTVFDQQNSIMGMVLKGKVPDSFYMERALSAFSQPLNLERVNKTLKEKLSNYKRASLVIFGNPSDEVLSKIKSIDSINFVDKKAAVSMLE